MFRKTILAGFLVCIFTQPAYAYIDPGVASIALQFIIGGIAVGGLFFRSKIAQVVRFFRPGKRQEKDAQSNNPESADDS